MKDSSAIYHQFIKSLLDSILKQFLKKPGFFVKSLTFFKPVDLIEPRVTVHHHESHLALSSLLRLLRIKGIPWQFVSVGCDSFLPWPDSYLFYLFLALFLSPRTPNVGLLSNLSSHLRSGFQARKRTVLLFSDLRQSHPPKIFQTETSCDAPQPWEGLPREHLSRFHP